MRPFLYAVATGGASEVSHEENRPNDDLCIECSRIPHVFSRRVRPVSLGLIACLAHTRRYFAGTLARQLPEPRCLADWLGSYGFVQQRSEFFRPDDQFGTDAVLQQPG